jgi:hypothetical protein
MGNWTLLNDHIELINLWAAQQDWPTTDAFLTEHTQVLRGDSFRASLSVSLTCTLATRR